MPEIRRITSVSNPIIKEVKSLLSKKGRKLYNSFLLEGTRLVAEALNSDAEIKYFIVSDSYYESNSIPDGKVFLIPDALFEKISETRTPQGIMAVTTIPRHDVSGLLEKHNKYLVLENLQDPGNLGTIIRAAHAFEFDGILISNDSVDPYNPKVIRSTMGSIFHLPVLVCHDIYQELEGLKSRGIRLAAAHPRDAEPLYNTEISENIAIIIGNEGNGLTERMLELSDFSVMIPMPGRSESLNASSAASILLYESMRQSYMKQM